MIDSSSATPTTIQTVETAYSDNKALIAVMTIAAFSTLVGVGIMIATTSFIVCYVKKRLRGRQGWLDAFLYLSCSKCFAFVMVGESGIHAKANPCYVSSGSIKDTKNGNPIYATVF